MIYLYLQLFTYIHIYISIYYNVNIYICLRDLLVLFDAHELTKQITNIDYIYSIYVIYYICLIVSLWRKICILFIFLSIYLF